MTAARAERIAQVAYDYAAQPKRELRACVLCGSARLTTVAHEDRYGFAAQSSLCGDCGVVFLNPAMTPDAYAAFYADVYRPLVSAYHGRRIDAESIQPEQREYADDVARFIDAWRGDTPISAILDVGGSTGAVVQPIAQRFGARATVLDPASLETQVAAALGLRTVTGFIEDYDAGAERYDLVLLAQTIDHLLDAGAALRKIRALLAEGGCCFVDIVDLRAGIARSGSLVGALKIDHPFAFVEETAELLLARVGLRIVGKERAPDGLHVRYLGETAAPAPEVQAANGAVAALAREIEQAAS